MEDNKGFIYAIVIASVISVIIIAMLSFLKIKDNNNFTTVTIKINSEKEKTYLISISDKKEITLYENQKEIRFIHHELSQNINGEKIYIKQSIIIPMYNIEYIIFNER